MTPFSRRIQIVGSSNAGKSTLAAQLASETGYPLVELDALNFKPGWQGRSQHEPDEFRRLIREATVGDSWIVAGNYTVFSQEITWPRADVIVWLDLPLSLLTVRMLCRSWKRWRTQELLWGTNRERFWPQLRVWHSDSLFNWLWLNYRRYRENLIDAQQDERWKHLRFVHLKSRKEVARFLREF